MSGKCKSNPIKTNNLIYIMIFFWGGGNKISRGGGKLKIFTLPPLQNPYVRPCNRVSYFILKDQDWKIL